MKALYIAIIGSALVTAYAPDITLASEHINPKAIHGSLTVKADAELAAAMPAAPAACMIAGKAQIPGEPFANGGVNVHVYNLSRPLPADLEGRIYLTIGHKRIPLTITKNGNGSIISFISEGELARITEAMETSSSSMRVLKAHPLWQAAAYVPAPPAAAILSCANTAPVPAAQGFQ